MPAAFSPPLPPTQTLALLTRLADVLPWPLLVLQPDAALVYANRAGRDLLARAQPLHLGHQGQVGPAQVAQQAPFEQALARASAGGRAALVLPGRSEVHQVRLERLAGEGPVLLLLSLSLPDGLATDWPQSM